jgi:hypothetical protein
LAVNAAGNFLSTAAQPAFGKSNCQWLFSNPTSDAIYLQQTNGGPAGPVNFSNLGVTIENTCYFGIGGTSYAGNATVKLARDADGILAQRNGTAKQTLRIYNTYTSATVYERAVMDWNGPTPGNLQIGTEFLGSGSGMAARPIDFVTGGVARWQISAAGHLMSAGVTDNLYDIGASGANRPRSLYVAGNSVFGNNVAALTATPLNVSFGGTFGSNAPGSQANLKWDLFNQNNANRYGIGMSSALMEFQAGNNNDGNFAWYTGSATERMKLTTAGNLLLGNTTAVSGARLEVTGAISATTTIKVTPVAVASLPAAATAGVGARSFVNDAMTPVFGSAVTGGGAVTVPVYSTGSAWNVG